MAYLWVALGGALGSVARYACSIGAARWLGASFPWGTLLVNVAGSFAIGLLAALVDRRRPAAAREPTRARSCIDRRARRLHDVLVVQPGDAELARGGALGAARRERRAVASCSASAACGSASQPPALLNR